MTRKKICPQCLKLISEGSRVKIVEQLKRKPKNVSQIVKNFSLTQPTISYHLRVLEKMGMVLSKKRGREIYYSLNKKYPCKKCLLFKLPFRV